MIRNYRALSNAYSVLKDKEIEFVVKYKKENRRLKDEKRNQKNTK